MCPYGSPGRSTTATSPAGRRGAQTTGPIVMGYWMASASPRTTQAGHDEAMNEPGPGRRGAATHGRADEL